MPERSTRNKIRWQGKKILDKIEDIYQHLAYIEELAGGRSQYINENLPTLTALTNEYEKVIKAFYEGL